jgi:hypothetical protein
MNIALHLDKPAPATVLNVQWEQLPGALPDVTPEPAPMSESILETNQPLGVSRGEPFANPMEHDRSRYERSVR